MTRTLLACIALLLTLTLAATAYIAYRLGRAEAQDAAAAEQERLRQLGLKACDLYDVEVATHRRLERLRAQAAMALREHLDSTREHLDLMAADNERLTEENTSWRQWFYKAESEMDAYAAAFDVLEEPGAEGWRTSSSDPKTES